MKNATDETGTFHETEKLTVTSGGHSVGSVGNGQCRSRVPGGNRLYFRVSLEASFNYICQLDLLDTHFCCDNKPNLT